ERVGNPKPAPPVPQQSSSSQNETKDSPQPQRPQPGERNTADLNTSQSATESLHSPSPEDPARIDPNFRLDGFQPNMIHCRGVEGQEGIPPLLILSHSAYQVVARAYGSPVDGVNLSLGAAQEIAVKLREQAANEPASLIRTKLEDLARKLDQNM